jgi:hypothetical protein
MVGEGVINDCSATIFSKANRLQSAGALRHNMVSSRVSKTSQPVLFSSWNVWKKMKMLASARSDVFVCLFPLWTDNPLSPLGNYVTFPRSEKGNQNKKKSYKLLPVFMKNLQKWIKRTKICKVTSVRRCNEQRRITVQPLRHISLKNSVWANTVYCSYPLYPSPLYCHTLRPETDFCSVLVSLLKDRDSTHSVSASFLNVA